ncbi:MAG: hypothetical protein RLZZ501_1494 [Pseudomonadota bacterium]
MRRPYRLFTSTISALGLILLAAAAGKSARAEEISGVTGSTGAADTAGGVGTTISTPGTYTVGTGVTVSGGTGGIGSLNTSQSSHPQSARGGDALKNTASGVDLTVSGAVIGGSGGAAVKYTTGTVTQPIEDYSSGGAGGDGLNNTGTINTLTITPGGRITGGAGGETDPTTSGNAIAGPQGYGVYNANGATITDLINLGTISGLIDLYNLGTIGALTNAQSGLTYYGSLPSSYTTYFSTSSSYGTVVFSGTTTATSLTYSLAKANGARYAVGTYADVITSSAALTLTTVTISGVTYSIAQDASCSGSNYCYDLTISAVYNWATLGRTVGGNAAALGATLDRIADAGGLSSQLTRLSTLSDAAQGHALKQLTASDLAVSMLSSGATMTPSNNAIGSHLDLAMSSGATGMAAGGAFQKGTVWGQVLGNHASLDGSSSSDGFSSNSIGLLVGADTDVADNAVAGLAVNWLRSYAWGKGESSGNSAITDSYQFNLYGSWRPDGQAAWMQGVASVGVNQYNQKRNIDYLGETASAHYQGVQMQAKIAGGYDVPMDSGLIVTPQASLRLSRVQNQSYTETGSSVNQAVDAQGFNSVESVLGGKVSRKLGTNWGALTADAQIGWIHDYIKDPITVTSTLDGFGYAVSTARLPSNGAQIGLGVTLQRSDELSLSLDYNGDLRDGYGSHTGLLKANWAF